MSFSRAVSFALLTLFSPTASAAQLLTVTLGWRESTIQPQSKISCPDGGEGFEIATSDIPSSVRGSAEFSLDSKAKVLVRKGNTISVEKNGLRPALRTVNSKNGDSPEQLETVFANAHVRLIGCRYPDRLEIQDAHLRLIGEAVKFRVVLDKNLRELTKLNSGHTPFKITSLVESSGELYDKKTGDLVYVPSNLKGEKLLGRLSLSFLQTDWQFPSMEEGKRALNGTLNVHGFAFLVDTPAETSNPIN